ncbi:MAG: signal recognition particle protein [Flavobacteriales bacterium]|jgi:signal recognition particle subunit SRP54|nr:signal recognition particle protein [Flavobacteriales bacterium]MBL6868630.1 signal recognition particle protein [Flavobacteriales bacterium]CAI8161055.1 MAG: Signal recognition particle protein [Crocinitomicaceae bacterium]
MFENLQDRFERAFKVLKGQGQITEINVAETLKEVRRALLEADVSFNTAKAFTNRVKERALGQNVLNSISPSQLLVKITQEELTELMGSEKADINVNGNPGIVLMSGLQGSGKTTFSGKLANYLKTKKNKKPLLVACDVYRPAAIDQLHVVGDGIGVEVFSNKEEKSPLQIAKMGVKHAKENGFNIVIIDTAGRLAVDEDMMKEISDLKKNINPTETLFVVDSMTGQDAVNTAKSFNEKVDFDGVILTKLDGDTRGGAALSIKSVVNKPIKFIGTGEKMDAIDVFHPDRMADRILGMGDVVSLVERAQEQFDEESAKKLHKKIKKNQFDFNDFRDQIGQIKKMGGVKDIAGMIPGMKKAMKGSEVDENSFSPILAMIDSMTPKEREFPDSINMQRKKRIAMGSGNDLNEVNKLMKQFNQTKKMMKLMSNKQNMMNMMKQFKKMGGKMPM